MNISQSILKLFPSAKPNIDFEVQDDGDGSYIAQWNLPQPKPTEAELEAAWLQVKDMPAPKTEVESLKEENLQLNNQIIDLWETLLNAGVL